MTSILRVLEKERATSEEPRKEHLVDEIDHGQPAQAAGGHEEARQETDSDDSWDLDKAEGKNPGRTKRVHFGSLNDDTNERLRSRKAGKEARKNDEDDDDGDGDGDGGDGGD